MRTDHLEGKLHSRAFALTAALSVLLCWGVGVVSPARAASILVNTADDEDNNDGDCSLREAVHAANNNAPRDDCNSGNTGTDTIAILVNGTIVLSGELVVTEALSVSGLGRDVTSISGNGQTRLFVVDLPDDTQDFELGLVTVEAGQAPFSQNGGAVRIDRGGTIRFSDIRFVGNRAGRDGGAIFAGVPAGDVARLEFSDCIFNDNSADNGAAIAVDGAPAFANLDSLVVQRCEFSDQQSTQDYGPVYLDGADFVSVTNSSFSDNSFAFLGGALFWRAADSGSLMLIDTSSFVSNNADFGGAIAQFGGVLGITNSTFHGQFGRSGGGSIFLDEQATAGIRFSTFVGNLTNDILARDGSSAVLQHNVFWLRGGDTDAHCEAQTGGSFSSQGYNLDTDASCTGHADDLPMTDPLLFALSDVGDAVAGVALRTMLPKPGSPLIDAGAVSDCPGLFGLSLQFDQRGEPRPVSSLGGGERCDIGAVERQGDDPSGVILSAVLTGSGEGGIGASPGSLDCPGRCEDHFLEGQTARVFAVSGPFSEFLGWNGDCSGVDPVCEVTMDSAKSVTAEFIALFGMLVLLQGNAVGAVVSDPPGLIDCTNDCFRLLRDGTTLELFATAASGNRFQNWTGDCSGTTGCEVSMSGARQVGAVFIDADTLFFDGFE